MSGADREVKVKFTTEHDGRGADEANKTIDKTKAKAGEAAGGFSRLGKAATGFKGVMERVNSAMAGFGLVALFQSIMRIVQAFADARKAHDDMVAAIGADNAAAGVARLKTAYEDLTKSIARTGEEVKAARENMDILIDAERRLEDAASVRREEDEVAALDKDDPLRKEKEADIRARYGQRRAETAGRRGVEDVAMQEAELRADIARLQENIAKRDGEIADLEAAASEYSGRAAAANSRAAEESQKTDWWGRKGRWGIGWQRKDANRYAGYANQFGQQAGAALEGVMQGERDNEADRRAAAAAEKRLAALARQREAAAAEGDNAARAATRTAEGASAGVREAAQRREREAAELERARAEKAELERQRSRMEEEKAAAAWRAQEEERQAGQARAALDAHAANPPPSGSRTRWRETLAALQAAYDREQTEANEAARALEALGEATAESMQAVNAKASAAASRIKALEARLGRDPHGDGEAQ